MAAETKTSGRYFSKKCIQPKYSRKLNNPREKEFIPMAVSREVTSGDLVVGNYFEGGTIVSREGSRIRVLTRHPFLDGGFFSRKYAVISVGERGQVEDLRAEANPTIVFPESKSYWELNQLWEGTQAQRK